MRSAGHQHVQPGTHRRLEERRGGRRQAAELDEVGEPGGLQHELANVDRYEAKYGSGLSCTLCAATQPPADRPSG